MRNAKCVMRNESAIFNAKIGIKNLEAQSSKLKAETGTGAVIYGGK